MGYSSGDHKESDTTEQLTNFNKEIDGVCVCVYMYVYISYSWAIPQIYKIRISKGKTSETCAFNTLRVCFRSNINFATHCPGSLRAEGKWRSERWSHWKRLGGQVSGLLKNPCPQAASMELRAEPLCGGCWTCCPPCPLPGEWGSPGTCNSGPARPLVSWVTTHESENSPDLYFPVHCTSVGFCVATVRPCELCKTEHGD